MPTHLHGADAEYSIRVVSERERLAIEDYLFRNGIRLALNPASTAVIVPQNETANASLEDFAILVEFALGVLTVSGFQPVTVVAALTASGCSEVVQRPYSDVARPSTFPKKLVNAAASTWVRSFFTARRNTKDKLHITAHRYVRYLRTDSSLDGLVDLCICLESLIEVQTEISFRFSMCLGKITGGKRAPEISSLLADLYDLRSKVVHGSDATKEHNKLQPKIANIRMVARTILTMYVLYIAEHTKEEWKKHLRNSLFA